MADMEIRKDRRAGRMTFNRPKALNALSHEMVKDIHAALLDWQDDSEVELIIIDAEGEKAFCAGGDIAAVYRAGLAGDHSTGQKFFFDEYRMNAAIADYPKPVIAFMNGFVMGGGVGVGGHASHRIVGDTTRIAMPESGIGLIPDVGGSWLLGKAPGRIGEYLMMTSNRMDAGDAIHAGFADYYIPEDQWTALSDRLAETADISAIKGQTPPESALAARDLSAFEADSIGEIIARLEAQGDTDSLKPIGRNSPLSMAAGLRLVREARKDSRMQDSLAREYRFTHRATQDGDFIEGVRAQIIDKDRNPAWSADASDQAVEAVLSPLGDAELNFTN
ncbi:enoyl-CoA hydratase/isomerase family protein [Paracoccus aerodenitrificans]|uniref:enoyl-CoA hydratase/isomerase family protein n=1 Tax=Paracoccus aerodenitrificans TaxID=3017781 RepID=UPI0022F00EDC|nr:enoyl-CoA hydratase/isomerase family protein [Paracoccus aerodenitrificans]WBU63377.1 enoyl-CoA hydratase/isomerase family protein [Paracoccus aerodenitrificans]